MGKEKAKESCTAVSHLESLLSELKIRTSAIGCVRVDCNGQLGADLMLSQSPEGRPRVPQWVAESWPDLSGACWPSPVSTPMSTPVSSSSDLSSMVEVKPSFASYTDLKPMLDQGPLPSNGTVTHSSNCWPCQPHLRGECPRGRVCHRCHGEHDPSEASHPGGRSRQRVARWRHREQTGV